MKSSKQKEVNIDFVRDALHVLQAVLQYIPVQYLSREIKSTLQRKGECKCTKEKKTPFIKV